MRSSTDFSDRVVAVYENEGNSDLSEFNIVPMKNSVMLPVIDENSEPTSYVASRTENQNAFRG